MWLPKTRLCPAATPQLPPQLQNPWKTAEVEVIETLRLLLVDLLGPLSVQQLRQDDGLIHLPFCAKLKTVTISHCVLNTTEGLAGPGNLVGHFIVDFGAAGERTVQICEVVHHLQLSVVHVDLGCDVCSVRWRLMHNPRLLRVDDQAEVLTGGGEKIHAPLHLPF
nr:unnamed protein product [Spirometra erinaceieuropaei]